MSCPDVDAEETSEEYTGVLSASTIRNCYIVSSLTIFFFTILPGVLILLGYWIKGKCHGSTPSAPEKQELDLQTVQENFEWDDGVNIPYVADIHEYLRSRQLPPNYLDNLLKKQKNEDPAVRHFPTTLLGKFDAQTQTETTIHSSIRQQSLPVEKTLSSKTLETQAENTKSHTRKTQVTTTKTKPTTTTSSQ